MRGDVLLTLCGFRPLMEATRDAARTLAAAGVVVVTQRGAAVPHDQPWHGPVRLQLAWRGTGGATGGDGGGAGKSRDGK